MTGCESSRLKSDGRGEFIRAACSQLSRAVKAAAGDLTQYKVANNVFRLGKMVMKMTSQNIQQKISGVTPEDAETMTKYGIKLLKTAYYHYRDFRYSNLKDAIAQAIHDQKPA